MMPFSKRFIIFVMSAVMVLAPAVSLAASPAGWSASAADIVMSGATATITAFKGSGATAMKAVISHKPTASAVGKELIKGAGLVALAYAASQLLGAGVDWVLDPENNRIKYSEVSNEPSGDTWGWTGGYAGVSGKYFPTAEAACIAYLVAIGQEYHSTVGGACYYSYNGGTRHGATFSYTSNPNGQTAVDKYLPIDTVAAKVIANAEAGHAESQEFVKAVAVGAANAGDLDTAFEAVAEPTTDTPNPDAPPVDPTKPFDPSGILDYLNKILASLGLLSILGTISDSITSLADWFKSEPEKKPDKDSEVEIVELPPSPKEVDINFGGSCPADKIVPIQFAGQSINFTLSYTLICTAMGVIKPVVVMVAMMSYMFIVSGNRENS